MVALILIGAAFILIPSQIHITQKIGVRASQNGITKLLLNKEEWRQWWPSDTQIYQYRSNDFFLGQPLLHKVTMEIKSGNHRALAYFSALSYNDDSSIVMAQVVLPAVSNPFKKVSQYLAANKLKRDLSVLLLRLRSSAENTYHIYGLHIHEEKVVDSTLVAIKKTFRNYPDDKAIYALITELKNYIFSKDVQQTNYPMLHMQQEDSVSYEVMVAIPINKVLKGNGTIVPKRMVLGKILTAEVKGGEKTVEKAMFEMEEYVHDYHRPSPAIPYESLVTDRSKEPDTSKWITKIYYPVF